jgi:ketosteroid isomerase-like protein
MTAATTSSDRVDRLPTDAAGFRRWAEAYFGAKSRHDLEALVGLFDPGIGYEDAVLCRRTTGADRMRATYAAIFASAAGAADPAGSTLTWVAGSDRGGAVQFVNDAGLFGAPMRVVAVIELDHGRVARQRDYWDGRALPASALADLRASYPAHLRPAGLAAEQRSPRSQALAGAARAFRAALEARSGIAPLLTGDAVFEDPARGVLVRTGDAVAAHLAHWSAALPYGHGATETNIVGGTGGGAWEWIPSPPFAQTVGAGATAVRLAPDGRIAELIVGWDTSRLSSRERLALPEGDDRR